MRLDSYIGATSDNLNLFSGVELSDGQREAVLVASQAPILILTGGPGCGKTYATATIVKLWRLLRREVKLAAPTGNPLPPPLPPPPDTLSSTLPFLFHSSSYVLYV